MNTHTRRTAGTACALVLSMITVAACATPTAGQPTAGQPAAGRPAAAAAMPPMTGSTASVPATTVAGSPDTDVRAATIPDVEGRFRPWSGPRKIAVTYDKLQVPVGAQVEVSVSPEGSSTEITLKVNDLQASRAYGAHLHNNACGAQPADAGSHYQNVVDPVTPSTDPRYANPSNEVWLDFTTDREGEAKARSVVPFVFRTGAAAPHSVVIHATHTMTGAGMAGMAGARLACVNIAGGYGDAPDEIGTGD